MATGDTSHPTIREVLSEFLAAQASAFRKPSCSNQRARGSSLPSWQGDSYCLGHHLALYYPAMGSQSTMAIENELQAGRCGHPRFGRSPVPDIRKRGTPRG